MSDTACRDEAFRAAAAAAPSLPKSCTNENKLKLYAYFKQAKVGSAPEQANAGVFDIVAKEKHKAWLALGTMPAEEAREFYIALVNQLQQEECTPPRESQSEGAPVMNDKPPIHSASHSSFFAARITEAGEPFERSEKKERERKGKKGGEKSDAATNSDETGTVEDAPAPTEMYTIEAAIEMIRSAMREAHPSIRVPTLLGGVLPPGLSHWSACLPWLRNCLPVCAPAAPLQERFLLITTDLFEKMTISWHVDHSEAVAGTELLWFCWAVFVAKQDGKGSVNISETARGGNGFSHGRIAKRAQLERLSAQLSVLLASQEIV